MKALFCAFGLCILAIAGKAQQNYDTGLIPKELLSYANTVVRYSDKTIEVKNPEDYTYHVKTAITVLNKNGDSNAELVLYYDKTGYIKSVKGSVYNSAGKLIGKIAEKDFSDASAANDFSLFEDSRVKHYQPAVVDYPYTVEYEYEMREKQTMFFYDWQPNQSAGVAIQKSSFSVISKPDFKIRYKETNTPQPVSVTINPQGLKAYQWQISDLKALKYEPYSPDHYLTRVKIAPEKFTYFGIAGQFTNWFELGKWIYDKLLTGRDALPTATVSTVKQLVEGITDPKLKAKKVYEYMQQKTRYVSIQVGIGGFQPFLASDVDASGYGDCKALVNYTHALLKEAGIESWYCVVEAGARKESCLPDFASMDQGNHAILCLPFKNDTTWLECTSQNIPFGFLGDFTDDRMVLACTAQGGKLLHTPSYESSTLTKRTGDFVIDNAGNLSGAMATAFTGTDYDERNSLIDEPNNERLKSIQSIYPIANFDVEKLEYTQNKTINPLTTENIKFNSREFASLNSDKFYFKVNLTNRRPHVPDEVRNRVTDVYINRGYMEQDEISYRLPDGYHPDKTLLNRSVQKPFGKFTVSMHLNGNQLVYNRRFELKGGTYPKDMYQDLVDFYQTVADMDGYNMALVKSN